MHPLKIAVLVAAVVVVFLVVISLITSVSFSPTSISFGDNIGVLEIDGVIGDGMGYDVQTRELNGVLRRWAKDESIKGIVVRINSPGGTVGATQELYHQLLEYRKDTGRPVIASMGDLAASGGYYTAMACDEIYANPGTLTGSIGVLLRFLNYEQLTDKVGLEFNVIKSGQFKDIGSGSRPMTPEEEKLLQETIDNVYGQFLEAVTNGRANAIREHLAEDEERAESDITYDELTSYVKQYADGRIFSGEQAHDYALVDRLGTFQSAVERVKKLAGITGEARLITSRRPKGLLESLTGETHSFINDFTPGHVSLEYRFALP